MKIKTKLGSKIHWVCRDCGQTALKLPENAGKKQSEVSTFHNGKCDVCGEDRSVTEARDYMYPVFEVESKGEGA